MAKNKAHIQITIDVEFDQNNNPVGSNNKFDIEIQGSFNLEMLSDIYVNTISTIIRDLNSQIRKGYHDSLIKSQKEN